MTEDEAREKMAIVRRGADFEALVKTHGWQLVGAWFAEFIQTNLNGLRDVKTADSATAINALQRWQIAVDIIEKLAETIDSTIEEANKLRGNLTMDDALLMEKMDEQPESRPDPAGY